MLSFFGIGPPRFMSSVQAGANSPGGRKHLKVSKDIFHSHNWGPAPDTWWVVAKDAVKLSTACRMAALYPCSQTKTSVSPNA